MTPPIEAVTPPAEQQAILAVEAQLCRAVLEKNRVLAAQIMADDAVAIGHVGNVVDKKTYLDVHFAPERDFTVFAPSQQQVRLLGPDAAIVTGQISVVNSKATTPPSPPYRYLAAYARREGRWQIVAWQETPVQANAKF